MGLDLALGGLVLVVAIRGWLKGFLTQAIRLGGLVASAYAAAPLRDQVKPYAVGQLPSMRPELLDRLLWWGLAFASYFVIVGAAGLIVSVSRRQSFGMAEPNRGDQFAGFGFGVLKGLILAAFAVAGLQRYAEPHIAKVDWAARQRDDSYAWKWNNRYHPAARIWATPPVQSFVSHVQKMGFLGVPKPGSKSEASAEPPVQTASRVPKLAIPAEPAQSRSAAADRRRVTRRPLVLKHPVEGRPALGSQQPSRPESAAPEFDTSGLDPEMASQVESILGKLRSMGPLTGVDN